MASESVLLAWLDDDWGNKNTIKKKENYRNLVSIHCFSPTKITSVTYLEIIVIGNGTGS